MTMEILITRNILLIQLRIVQLRVSLIVNSMYQVGVAEFMYYASYENNNKINIIYKH